MNQPYGHSHPGQHYGPAYGGPGPQAYGGAGYGAPGYAGYPGQGYYGPGSHQPAPRANPAAGILLLLGALAGIAACLIPNSYDQIPIVSAFELIDDAGESIPMKSGLLAGFAPITLLAGSLLALIAGMLMFAARRHGGAATTGVIGSVLMLACPVLMLIATEGHLFDGDMTFHLVLMLVAWLPALIGALIGYRR